MVNNQNTRKSKNSSGKLTSRGESSRKRIIQQ